MDYLPYRRTNYDITIYMYIMLISVALAQCEIFCAKVGVFWHEWYKVLLKGGPPKCSGSTVTGLH